MNIYQIYILFFDNNLRNLFETRNPRYPVNECNLFARGNNKGSNARLCDEIFYNPIYDSGNNIFNARNNKNRGLLRTRELEWKKNVESEIIILAIVNQSSNEVEGWITSVQYTGKFYRKMFQTQNNIQI